ncbi:MAG TPA: thioredoxin domain-containing protein [Kofleriaceae bacterium]
MRRVVCALLLAAGIAHAGGTSQTAPARASFDPNASYKVPRGHGPVEGPANAPLTIVDWSDYACGYCNRAQEALDRLDRLYPGQIRWVHRILPLDDDNTVAAEATLAAAAQGRFRPMHDRLYAVRGHVDRAAVEMIGQELGLDMIAFRAALDAGTYRAQIIEDVRDAEAIGVTGTPTFFVNGHVVHGSAPLAVFTAVADQELARAAAHPGDYESLVASGHAAAAAPPDANNAPVELDANKAYRVGLGLPGHQLGPDNALVTIVEFSDFQCPYCAKEAPVLAKLHAKYGDQVRIIYRHMGFHRNSLLAAEAAVAAADQGKFWPFHDLVFGNFGHLSRADLEGFAKTAGLDLAKFRAALDDRRYHDLVVQETAAAEALGVDGTPTMFINGQPISGAMDQDRLEKYLNAALGHAKDAVAHGVPQLDLYALVMSMAEGEDRADPSTIPDASASAGGHLEMRSDDRVRAVGAACRRHDGTRAQTLSGRLAGEAKQRATDVCSVEGVDLP